MYQVSRGNRVLGKMLGRRDLADTKAEAVRKFGKGVAVKRVF